jgi:3-phosphoshikimate 1-carboxyvinyltransferase
MATFTGLESLRIKETDRIAALQKELRKLGASLTEQGNAWQLIPAPHLPEAIEPICTYNDHRMAMAFAPVAALRTLHIENPQVVKKSYPRFWDDVRHTGIVITGL